MKAAFSGGQSLMRFLRFVLPLVMCMFAAGAFAQGGNVAITGTVMDPSGAVVVGAKVTVTQQGTGTVRTDTTDSNGQFNVVSIPPAGYSIAVEAPGFKKYVEKVVLLADQTRNMMIHLQLGSASQEITVETSSAQVNTVSQELSQVIERSRVVDLPLNGRNAADLTLLVPGAVNAMPNNSGTLQGDTKQIPGAEAISVNGARPDQIAYNLDGGNNEDLMSNTNDPFPFPDALQEFSVQTNSFDVQYGINAGAVVNVVSKSGTNQWHGDAFEFVRNRAFNGTNYFSNVKDPLKRNQFGGTIGGPIHKNTSFIFFGGQKTIIRSILNGNSAVVPTVDNMQGNFSLTNPALANNTQCDVVPNTPQPNICNPATHVPFASNASIGPVDPVAKAMSAFLPLLPAGSTGGSVPYGLPVRLDFNEYLTRFDQALRGGQDHLFGRFYLNRYVHAPSYDGKNLLTVGTGSKVQAQNWAVGYTSVITSDLVNNLVIDFVRSDSDRTQQGGPGGNVPDMSTFDAGVTTTTPKIPQLPAGQSGIRAFNVTSDFNISQFTDGVFVRNTADLRDMLSWTKGKHNFEFGYDLELDQANVRNTDLENGSYTFTNDVTGLAMASFVLGYTHQFSQTSGNYSDSRENPMGLFAGDKWKVSNRLTLDLGLRYEPQQVMKEIRGRIQQFRPDAQMAGVHSSVIPSAPAGLFFIGDSYNNIGVPDRGETGDFKNFGPRVGFAWDPTGTGKMSLRGGGGLFFISRQPGLFLNDASISAPFSLRIDLNDSLTGNSQIGPLASPEANYASFVSAFPQRFTLSEAPKNATFVANPQLYSLQPGVAWFTPQVYDWNLTYEYQLRPDTVLHASYVGMRGTHLRQDVNLNPTAPGGTGAQSTRPYQPFGNIYENRNSGGSRYNALEVDLEKRPVANGGNILNQITLLANYTLSRATDYGLAENGGITDIGSSIGSGMSFYDPRQHDFETGPSTFDHTHHFVASYVWNLPKLTSSNAVVRDTAGGWQWTGIYNFISGDPLTLLAGSNVSKTGNNGDRVDYVGPAGQLGSRGTPSACPTPPAGKFQACRAWLNAAAFALPATGNYGNSGKGSYRGPNLWDADTGLLKNFAPMQSHENWNFQFRAEFFNIFNHPQWADPVQTYCAPSSSCFFGNIRQTLGTQENNNFSSNDYRIIQFALKMNF